MSLRSWLLYAALAGCLIAIVFGLAAVILAEPVTGQISSAESVNQSETELSGEADYTSISVIERDVQRIASALEAVYDASEAPEEKSRAQRDLQAQERMAYWAFWMFIIGFAQAALSAGGIILIWKTLALNDEATKAAIKAARAAELTAEADRPWACFTHDLIQQEATLSANGDVPAKFGYGFKIGLKNYGRSPAVDLQIFVSQKVIGFTDKIPQFTPDFTDPKSTITNCGPGDEIPVSPVFIWDDEFLDVVNRKSVLILYISARYRHPANPKFFETEICAMIQKVGAKTDKATGKKEFAFMLGFVGPQNRMA